MVRDIDFGTLRPDELIHIYTDGSTPADQDDEEAGPAWAIVVVRKILS